MKIDILLIGILVTASFSCKHRSKKIEKNENICGTTGPHEVSGELPNTYKKMISSIQKISTSYSIDHESEEVFYNGILIEGADSQTFEKISDNYGKDSKSVYYNGILIDNADPETFIEIGKGFYKDKKGVFFEWTKIPKLDPASFAIISNIQVKPDSLDSIYTKDLNLVFFGTFQIKYADPNSFEIIGDEYSKDKQYVFYTSGRIWGADPNTIEIIGKGVSKDHVSVYYSIWPLKEADANTITFSDGILRDNNNVYCGRSILKDADPASFSRISGAYFKDKYRVYKYSLQNNCMVVELAHSPTFEILENGYHKDKDRVWYFGSVIEGADGGSFKYIGNQISKDTNHVFFRSKILKNIDSPSFQKDIVRDNPNQIYFRDNAKVYSPIGTDYSTIFKRGIKQSEFELIGGPFVRIQNQVYFYNIKLEGVKDDDFKFLECSMIKRYGQAILLKTGQDMQLHSNQISPRYCYYKRGEKTYEMVDKCYIYGGTSDFY